MQSYLDFEKPVADLEGKIAELKSMAAADGGLSIDEEVTRLSVRAEEALTDIYRRLTPWQKTQVARHPQRPHFSDYVNHLITEWTPLAGDRKFGEDAALQAGFGRFNGESVAILGQEKGSDTASRLKHNFGMANPEGYRKAVRIMDMADRFNIPLISFVDTSGAFPGIEAEERGQAEAIARSTEKCLDSEPCGRHWRRRFGRRYCDRYRQSHADARERRLLGDLAGGRRLDTVARPRQGAGRGQQHEDHGPRPAQFRGDRRHHSRATWRRAPASGGGDGLDARSDQPVPERLRRPQPVGAA
jgi:hypothetical protein